MKRIIRLLIFAGIVVIAMSAFHYLTSPGRGDAAPRFEIPNLDGKTVAMDEFGGRPLAIYFFATWCGYCVRGFPSIIRLEGDFRDRGLAVVGISVDEKVSEGAVSRLRDSFDVSFPILLDQRGTVADAYGNSGVPETILVDKNGFIVDRFFGQIDWQTKEMTDIVEKMVSGGGEAK